MSPAYIPLYSRFRFGVYSLITVCTAPYVELGLISIIRFVEIRTILVLILHFAVSKNYEILSLCTGDHVSKLKVVVIDKNTIRDASRFKMTK